MGSEKMTKAMLVFCSCASEDEAKRLATTLVERRLAACVNILPAMSSVYRWEGAVQTATEHLLLIKTLEEHAARVAEALVELHSYDLPEVITVPITGGSETYLAWICESVLG